MKPRPRVIDLRKAHIEPAEQKQLRIKINSKRTARREARDDPPLTPAQRSRLSTLFRR